MPKPFRALGFLCGVPASLCVLTGGAFAGDATAQTATVLTIPTSLLIDDEISARPDGGAESVTKPAEEAGSESANAAELAKKLSNPVANLISVPFQFNYDDGYGPKDGGRLTLNIQPVIPISITEDFNMIVRTIVPVIYQASPAEGIDDQLAIGDTTQSFFFSPKKPIGGWILGAGPAVLWPTGTDPLLRSQQLGLGPTVVALRQHDGWTYGILANHIWGVTESDSHADVNSTFLQPFLSYTFKTATSVTLNTESTYNWTAEEWTVPINLMVAQVMKFGKLPVQLFVGGRYYAESPDDAPDWGLRFGFTFLFPK